MAEVAIPGDAAAAYLRTSPGKAHGQVEAREFFVLAPVAGELDDWAGPRGIACAVKTLGPTRPGSEERAETRYYLTSLGGLGEAADP